jgi:tetratricopeptide (TPR) repeat protein
VLALDRGNAAAAREAFDAAIAADPTLTAAWANRAVLAFQCGDPRGAADDLSAAIALDDRADLRINRAITYEALERFADALADYDRALGDDDVDVEAAEAGRQRCLGVLGTSDNAA